MLRFFAMVRRGGVRRTGRAEASGIANRRPRPDVTLGFRDPTRICF